jgi:MurNAc alpha-1-phosphate uridylyltransferase
MTDWRAMILAAGLGTRMRPLTERLPKPLLPLCGRPLIDHILARLQAFGVAEAVVNAHWQKEALARHLERWTPPPRLHLRYEPELLDTGGAVRAALAEGQLGPRPFFVINGDAFWTDGPRPALVRLVEAFEREGAGTVDGVLLCHRTVHVRGEVGCGDFFIDPWGRPRRRGERELAPFVYAGVQLLAPSLFADAPEGAFSMNLLWDRAIARGRLRAVVHDGLWFHLSTPADLKRAEEIFQFGYTGESR